MSQFVDSAWMETELCCRCGMQFAMTRDFVRRRREDNNNFYCPAGHPQHYTKNQLQELRDELARKDHELVEKTLQLCDVKTRLSSVSRAHTKMRQRVANGVCPCCNRTFQNLMRHMRVEHPDFSSSKALFALRTAFGLTQADIAKEIGISAQYISLYEHGKPVSSRAGKRIDQWVEMHNTEETS